jgi:hypothetical protein
MKNFTGRPFFSLFFIARANQKIPNLALGRESSPQGQDTAFLLSCIGLLALDQSMCKVFMLFIMFIALRYFVADFVADFVVAPEMMR